MRSLHVAALPFPSAQGTQALLHSMLSTLASAGHDTHLLCYAHGAEPTPQLRYRVHRLPFTLGLRSLRSGPGARKLALDGLLVWSLRRLHAQLAPTLVVAHHVEAALACHLARVPFVFVAHTSLQHELPSYFPPAFVDPLARAGGALDAFLSARARAVLTVSPLLAQLLQARGAAAQIDVPSATGRALVAAHGRTSPSVPSGSATVAYSVFVRAVPVTV